MLPNKDEMVFIQSYKHDGSLHRTWSKGLVLESSEDRMVVLTNHTWVSESDGRHWLTREPAICFFYPNKWYNVISMIRKTGIFYYCNIASPSIFDNEAIKNIDYDLDVKLYPNGRRFILDEDEYQFHQKYMNYEDDLKEVIENALSGLLDDIQNKISPFDSSEINELYERYLKYHN